MNYTVLWLPGAEQELADLWMAAPDRAAVTRAAHDLDNRLRVNAPHEGESRDAGRRILFVAPLAVIFQVFPEDRIVRVIHVWHGAS